jgi:glutamate/tyrosine decarboxylase-like PLP-dependent enzyme
MMAARSASEPAASAQVRIAGRGDLILASDLDREMLTMPLHERDTFREQLADSVFAGHNLTSTIPKYRFPPDETMAREVFQVVADELMLDGNARQTLATFCQTWAEPEVMALMALSVNKNMIDKDEYGMG